MRKCWLILFLLPCVLLSQSIFRKPLNDSTFSQWTDYIKTYAPSDSAFRVFNYLINSYNNLNRGLIAYKIWKEFSPLFPNRKPTLQQLLDNIKEIAIYPTPKEEDYPVLEEFIQDFAPDEYAFVALKRRAENLINYRKWDSAVAIFRKFMHLFPEKKKHIEKIIEILLAPTEGLVVHNLGPNINTSADEWDPCPTPDGSYIFFSTRGRPDSYGNSDVYFAKNENGVWQKSQNVGPKINGKRDETIDNIDPDGNGIWLSGTFEGTFGQFDIYYIKREENGWGPLQHLPYPINTQYVDEGACLSSDGKVLVFTSDRPGGVGEFHPYGRLYHGNIMGNMDIYVCFKTDSGWSQPVNLGATINTPYAERSPYLHPDGKTLYFSSDGHPGLGRLDVFKAVRLREDSWTEWSEPVNLGKEINTILDDWGYKVSLRGDSAFFASHWRTDGYGGWDLYSVTLPKYAKPQKFATVRGKIIDPFGKPLSAKINIEDLQTGKNIGTLSSNPENGSFLIVLPLGKNYGYYAEKEGYFPISNNIDLTKFQQDTNISFDIILYPIEFLVEKQKKVRLNNIFFDFDKYDLKPESFLELDRVVKILNENPNFNIHIEGHTDSIGTEEYNLQLSRKRAEAVRNYLVSKGIARERITIFGFGASMPVATNETEEGRALNRRVEIWFVRR
ncbi:MAG: Outer membrane lipoprotein omp16 precursor [Candidatus Kapaibacterium sp.]|nr:MAG: Outer membrane lipoprotein omp16 precursor [Candidatus Kapabacteria bacterium]